MKARYPLISLLFFLLVTTTQAQVDPSRDEAAELQRLLARPDVNMRFQGAPLQDVIRTLAEASDMAYIGLPQPKEPISVDMTIRGNPYQGLELVAETYGYVPVYQNGLWSFRPIKEERSKLYPKIYKLNYIHLNEVNVDQQALNAATAKDSSSILPSPVNSSNFTSDPSRVIADIKALLELDPANLALTEAEALGVAPQASAQAGANPANLLLAGVRAEDLAVRLGTGAPSPERKMLKGRVIADPDQNALFVIATKEHHDWIATYLAAIDIKRVLILLETRVIEVSTSPESNFGIDWSGSLGAGYDLTLTDAETRWDIDGDGIFQELPGDRLFSTQLDGAILSGPELVSTLHALASTSDARSLQHPSQVTVNNRQVTLRNVIQQPFQSGSSSTSGGGGSTTSNEVQFIPIGTTIGLMPRILEGGNIELNIMINVSQLLRFELIGGGEAVAAAKIPVTSSRDYTGQAIVASGNTLAIGGLETLSEDNATSKIPVLGDLPLLGYLFKREEIKQENTQLLMFITATILDSYQGGVPTQPEVQKMLEDADQKLQERKAAEATRSKPAEKEKKQSSRKYLVK